MEKSYQELIKKTTIKNINPT